MFESLKKLFPVCVARLPDEFWTFSGWLPDMGVDPDLFLSQVGVFVDTTGTASYLPDLIRVEGAWSRIRNRDFVPIAVMDDYLINPTLELIPVSWHPLLPLLDGDNVTPRREDGILAFWQHPVKQVPQRCVATPSDLLALKIVVEHLNPLNLAEQNGQPVGMIDLAIEKGVNKGLLLAPPSKLIRVGAPFQNTGEIPATYFAAEAFTLQWHITHRCDLHCRHCYDRSDLKDVRFDQGVAILDQLRNFCVDRKVGGQVSFSGGNPFMHPDFFQLYRAARDRNLNLAILGNPVSEEQLDALLAIAKPSFYQVSLEGLEEHNDLIRGTGNFHSVLSFLALLKRKKIYSMVMLTLTRDNMDQVLPLAEALRDRVDLFTYNRLSMVGEGAQLVSPGAEEYRDFVRQYLQARKTNPAMALKDSLINIERIETPQGVFGGCTGYGCGAAFNFVSLLPDGQVHACRKFPSPIGDLRKASLAEIYDSERAKAYRLGCLECESCRIRPVCGGCLAVAYGWGLDPLRQKDPGCFIPPNEHPAG